MSEATDSPMVQMLRAHRERMADIGRRELAAYERMSELNTRLIFAHGLGNVPETAKPLVDEILKNGLAPKVANP